jgi:hypothetical protein
MWIFLIVTTLSTDPPRYDFNPQATTKTMSECMRMLEDYRKTDDSIKQQVYCIKAKP